MSELSASVQKQSDLVDQIAESAFIRGKFTREQEIFKKLTLAYDSGDIDHKTVSAVIKLLSKE